MTKNTPAGLYQQYYIDHNYERLELFQLLAEKYGVTSALYPGSFIHITPSFVYPVTCYVDTDKRARTFFADPATPGFIASRKHYEQPPCVTFLAADYQVGLPEKDETFDLLISQYAGFISQPCKRYLKIGGLLLVNNSHGDASMASLDADYEFIGVATLNKGKYRLSERDLDTYFVPRSEIAITREYITSIGRGVGYKKSPNAYLFRRRK